MSEATASKRPRCDNGNGHSVDSSEQVTSSSGGGSDAVESTLTSTTRSNLLSEADRALQESNRRHVKPVVDEATLGIELFVGDRSKQYHGLIKARYADFIVHEIDPEGKMALLDTLEPPVDEEVDSSGNIKLEDLFDRKVLVCLSNVSQGLLESYRIDVTGMDKDMRTSIHHAIKSEYDKLESATVGDNNVPVFKKQQEATEADESQGQSEDASEPTNDAQQADKGDKSSEKDEVKKAEKEATEQAPVPEEKKFILVKRRNKNTRPKSVWPRNRPDYTHFILYKENKDTMDAIHNIAMATHSKPAHYNYAGTKDRRAVTSQWVSSWRLDPGRLLSAMRRYNKRPFLKVGNFCFKKDPIRLGQLRANKFDIVIRHLIHNSGGVGVIQDAMNIVKEKGFVNYFGLQRFGTRSISTHEVGRAILQGNWGKAVEMVLSYRYDDNAQPPLTNPQATSGSGGDQTAEPVTNSDQDSNGKLQQQQHLGKKQQQQQNNNNKRFASGAEQHNACIDLWKSKQDADLVFKKYPHFRTTIEGLIIKALSRPNDFSQGHTDPKANAILCLPRNTRSMYVHAYQSLLWNKLTTLRLKKYGYQVIPGDLILRPEANISDNSLDILLAVDEPDTPEAVVRPPEETSQKNDPEQRKMPVEEIDANIVIATEENMANYSIFDVVLPLIGTKTRLPTNELGKELERLLAEDSITLESFRAREKAFISYGSYRKIMVRPNNLAWSLKQYSNPHENLVDTDLDVINREQSLASDKAAATGHDKRPGSPIKSDSSDEALIVSFELPPSCYATMCLRELMKKPSTDFNNRF